ncbi:MAG: sugar phosphate isomerase/epimerase family protein [Christensenellaceae bacterium]|jgi:sugar phosphate isomerase/epimerase
MKLGLAADCLGSLSLDEVLATCKQLGLQYIEIGCGAFSTAPHIDIENLLDDQSAQKEYVKKLADSNVEICAFNTSGNPLYPGEYGIQHTNDTLRTFKLAEQMGIKRVVMQSGLPGGCEGDKIPTWIISTWPPEIYDIHEYQWDICIKYWQGVCQAARDHGIEKIAIEPHGWQLVYSFGTFMRLRESLPGYEDLIGLNMDPSHLMWMGADPIQVIRQAHGMIYYSHLKDVMVNPDVCALNTLLDPLPTPNVYERSWNFVVPGTNGHDEVWWTSFVRELQLAGYDDVMSFENEDFYGDPQKQLSRGVKFMNRVIDM